MNLSSLPPSHSLDMCPDQQLSPADSPFDVASTFAPGQHVSGVPGKAIGQRGCKVNWFDDTDSAGSDSDNIDDHDPTRQEPEPKADDDDGSWQVVTRRQSRNKRHKPKTVAPGVGCGDARVKNSACEKSASAGQLPETSSADSGVTRQNQRLPLWRNDSISLSSITPCRYWPLCINSFAQLSKVDWKTFHSVMEKFFSYPRSRVGRENFEHFHHMMTEGPQAIRRAGDVVFLVDLFKVLLSEDAWSPDALLLSLVFERIVPGFLTMLGDRLVIGLTGLSHKHSKLFTPITELLFEICQKDEDWLDRLGWSKLSLRIRCVLFATMTFLFKQSNEKDLIRNLHQQVSGSWLEKHYYVTLQRVACEPVRRDPEGDLRDLRASVRAVFLWLEVQIFSVDKSQERSDLITRYADICDALLVVMDGLALPPSVLLFSLWRAVAQWSVRFRMHLTQYLGFDMTVSLLDRLLKKIDRWPGLDPLAFELRLSLLGSLLVKCEELMYRRNPVLFFEAWYEYEKKLALLLAECNGFMADYHPPFSIDEESNYAQTKENARLNLKLRESAFYRLDCEFCRSSRQCIEDNLQMCRRAFKYGWNLSRTHRNVGAIELAKWYFLAGEHDAGVGLLMDVHCEHARLSWKKATLLTRHGEFRAAVDELCHTKVLMTDSDEVDNHKRNKIDDQIAMTLLHWYEADADKDHLISAYRLCVDLLGRCDVQEREVYEGGLTHIVNAMKHSGLSFVDYARESSLLGYLAKDGCSIKSWQHLSDLLVIRHKAGLTNVDTVNKVASGIDRKYRFDLYLDKIL